METSVSEGPLISAIIPTLNAGSQIGRIIQALREQSLQVEEIIIVDSESEDRTVEICVNAGVSVRQIKRSDFNHGGTRDEAFHTSNGEYVLFLTNDVEIADDQLVKRLWEKLQTDSQMAAVYGCQVARKDASYMETLVREYNYPKQAHVYTEKDISKYGIKTFFMSDVCAMYRRNCYLQIGGFERDIKTNEDMFFAARAIRAGYSIGYEPEAKVIHSHNFSLCQQYWRNYIQGYEIERHKDLLGNIPATSAGKEMVLFITREMLRRGRFLSWIRFGFDCCARYLGNRAGAKKARQEVHTRIEN